MKSLTQSRMCSSITAASNPCDVRFKCKADGRYGPADECNENKSVIREGREDDIGAFHQSDQAGIVFFSKCSMVI